MSGTKLYPSRQAEFAAWLDQLATGVAASPAAVGVSVAQAALMTATNVSFQAAYATATAAETRTHAAILAKNVAMKNGKRESKKLADIVRAFPSITPSQLALLGIPVPAERRPVPAPDEMALVEVTSTGPNSLTVRIHGGEALRRGKPEGSTGCVVMSYIGAEAPTDVRLWTLEGTTSKNVFEVTYPADIEPGSYIWLAAAFVNAKLEQGPLTYPPVQIRLAGRVNATSGESAVKLAA